MASLRLSFQKLPQLLLVIHSAADRCVEEVKDVVGWYGEAGRLQRVALVDERDARLGQFLIAILLVLLLRIVLISLGLTFLFCLELLDALEQSYDLRNVAIVDDVVGAPADDFTCNSRDLSLADFDVHQFDVLRLVGRLLRGILPADIAPTYSLLALPRGADIRVRDGLRRHA